LTFASSLDSFLLRISFIQFDNFSKKADPFLILPLDIYFFNSSVPVILAQPWEVSGDIDILFVTGMALTKQGIFTVQVIGHIDFA